STDLIVKHLALANSCRSSLRESHRHDNFGIEIFPQVGRGYVYLHLLPLKPSQSALGTPGGQSLNRSSQLHWTLDSPVLDPPTPQSSSLKESHNGHFGIDTFPECCWCKLVFCVHTVGRASALASPSLEPSQSAPELQVSRAETASFPICWALRHPVLDPKRAGEYHFSSWNSKSITKKKDLRDCSVAVTSIITQSVRTASLSSYDILCLGPMIWVFILVSQRTPVLMNTVVSFYTLSSLFSLYLALFQNPNWWGVTKSVLITSCFPTCLFSFVLLVFLCSHEHGMSGFGSAQFPKLLRKCYILCGLSTTMSSHITECERHTESLPS
ncbi:hypothetical protein HPG69_003878, partial [Diceros bicornis minor]